MFFINPFIYAGGGDFESIATVTVGSGGASSIEFTSIPSTYQHLQIRWVTRAASNDDTLQYALSFNGDTTATNYRTHRMFGNGSSVGADSLQSGYSGIVVERQTGATAGTSIFGVGIIDILDYASTSKNKTVRSFGGADLNGSGTISTNSGLWMSTSAISSIRLRFTNSANFVQHSTAALYGVKAP